MREFSNEELDSGELTLNDGTVVGLRADAEGSRLFASINGWELPPAVLGILLLDWCAARALAKAKKADISRRVAVISADVPAFADEIARTRGFELRRGGPGFAGLRAELDYVAVHRHAGDLLLAFDNDGHYVADDGPNGGNPATIARLVYEMIAGYEETGEDLARRARAVDVMVD